MSSHDHLQGFVVVIADKGARLQLKLRAEFDSCVYTVLISVCMQIGNIEVTVEECTIVPVKSSGQMRCDRISLQTRRNFGSIALNYEDYTS